MTQIPTSPHVDQIGKQNPGPQPGAMLPPLDQRQPDGADYYLIDLAIKTASVNTWMLPPCPGFYIFSAVTRVFTGVFPTMDEILAYVNSPEIDSLCDGEKIIEVTHDRFEALAKLAIEANWS